MERASGDRCPRGTSSDGTAAGDSRAGWPRRIGVLNDYVRIPYANGSSFASQFLCREFTRRGHEVTIVGPRDPTARLEQLPPRSVLLPRVPLRNHPGVSLALPTRGALADLASRNLDVVLGQTCSGLMVAGTWLRARRGVPLLCVNTVHLPSVYNVMLPDRLNRRASIRTLFERHVIPRLERHTAQIYNQSDGLIVLSGGLEPYWRERGVRVPIHVIPRAVEPRIFDVPPGPDPFPVTASPGCRLLVICRHTREKGVARLLEIFGRSIAPAVPAATLTLVGDGPEHDSFKASARRLGVIERTHFLGERPVTETPRWYRHADLFVYTSLSETYGQVVSEALWCGLPVVAFADGMGVSQQVTDGQDGVLVPPEPDPAAADRRFAAEVTALLRSTSRRERLSVAARQNARRRSDPAACIARYYEAFEDARRHRREAGPAPGRVRTTAALVRWAGLHAAIAALGCVRRPAALNQSGQGQPSWGLPESPPG
jgi:1,2-diacylglycerol 3-alpha-glucosyltransferase